MRNIKVYLTMIALVVFISPHAFAQTSGTAKIKAMDGVRAYCDLNPTNQTQLYPGVCTFQGWTKSPKTGSFYRFASTDPSLIVLFQSWTVGAVNTPIRNSDSCIVFEGLPFDAISLEEGFQAYLQSPRIQDSIKNQNKAVADAQEAVSSATRDVKKAKCFSKEKKDANAKLVEANEQLAQALQRREEGEASREEDFARVREKLAELAANGSVFLKNIGKVAITEILTLELPTRQGGTITPATNQSLQPATTNPGGTRFKKK